MKYDEVITMAPLKKVPHTYVKDVRIARWKQRIIFVILYKNKGGSKNESRNNI